MEKEENRNPIKTFWEYLKKDTWDSWLVSMILLVIIIKFIFFPVLGFFTHTSLPIVIVESCSMYHESSFDEWWLRNSAWYEAHDINKTTFESYAMKNGFTKGDIIFVFGQKQYNKGDIIIFHAATPNPIIHRIITENPLSTKGDHNPDQIIYDKNIDSNSILGKAVFKIPLLGWIKLIFFEPFRAAAERGFCQ
jgi:signal peptidase I